MKSPELGIPFEGRVRFATHREIEGPLPAGVLVRRIGSTRWYVRKPGRAGSAGIPGHVYGFPAEEERASTAQVPAEIPEPDKTDAVMTQARYLDLSEGAVKHRLGRLPKEVLVDLVWRFVTAQYPLNGSGELDIHAPFDSETHERVRQVVADTESVWFHR